MTCPVIRGLGKTSQCVGGVGCGSPNGTSKELPNGGNCSRRYSQVTSLLMSCEVLLLYLMPAGDLNLSTLNLTQC